MTSHPFSNAYRLAADLLKHEKIRFLLVGGWNTLFGYLAFVVCYVLLEKMLGMNVILLIAYLISMLQSFVTQKSIVFRTGGSMLPQFLRFCTSNTLIFVVNVIVLPPATSLSGASPLVVQGFFVAISTVVAYYLHKHFSFL